MLINQSIIEQRAEEACHAEIHDNRYENLSSKVCRIQKRLQGMVPKNRRDEFFKLSEKLYDAEVQRQGIELRETYKQGFHDGLEIAVALLAHKK